MEGRFQIKKSSFGLYTKNQFFSNKRIEHLNLQLDSSVKHSIKKRSLKHSLNSTATEVAFLNQIQPTLRSVQKEENIIRKRLKFNPTKAVQQLQKITQEGSEYVRSKVCRVRVQQSGLMYLTPQYRVRQEAHLSCKKKFGFFQSRYQFYSHQQLLAFMRVQNQQFILLQIDQLTTAKVPTLKIVPRTDEDKPKQLRVIYLNSLRTLNNRMPVWDHLNDTYFLDFKGRAKISSPNNFILEEKGEEVMCFGKIKESQYRLEYCQPLSLLKALAIAVVNCEFSN